MELIRLEKRFPELYGLVLLDPERLVLEPTEAQPPFAGDVTLQLSFVE